MPSIFYEGRGYWRKTGSVTGGAIPICNAGPRREPQVGDTVRVGLSSRGWRDDLEARGLDYGLPAHVAMNPDWSHGTIVRREVSDEVPKVW